ncbi:hypothetical protein ABKN59_003129 [Abortiporus biennis]
MATPSPSTGATSSQPPQYRVIGVILAIGSGLLIGSSFVFKKKGLLSSQKDHVAGEGVAYLKSPMWWTGMTIMILGELCNFAAYAFVEAIIVTPMGALSVVISALLSHFILAEKLSLFGWISCVQCLLGASILALNGPEEQSVNTIEEFKHLFLKPWFLAYGGVVIAASVILVVWAAPRWGKKSMLPYLGVCSLIGGLSVSCTQGLGACILTSIRGQNQFKNWFIYFLFIFVIITLLTEIYYLNVALALFNTAMVTPTYYVTFTFCTLVTSVILYQGLKASATQIITIVLAFAVICTGIFILQMSKVDPRDLANVDERTTLLLEAARQEINPHGARSLELQPGLERRSTLRSRRSTRTRMSTVHTSPTSATLTTHLPRRSSEIARSPRSLVPTISGHGRTDGLPLTSVESLALSQGLGLRTYSSPLSGSDVDHERRQLEEERQGEARNEQISTDQRSPSHHEQDVDYDEGIVGDEEDFDEDTATEDEEERQAMIVEKIEEPGLDSLRGLSGAIGSFIRARRRARELEHLSMVRTRSRASRSIAGRSDAGGGHSRSGSASQGGTVMMNDNGPNAFSTGLTSHIHPHPVMQQIQSMPLPPSQGERPISWLRNFFWTSSPSASSPRSLPSSRSRGHSSQLATIPTSSSITNNIDFRGGGEKDIEKAEVSIIEDPDMDADEGNNTSSNITIGPRTRTHSSVHFSDGSRRSRSAPVVPTSVGALKPPSVPLSPGLQLETAEKGDIFWLCTPY